MKLAATPPNEVERLAALEALRIVDTPPEPFFDDIAELARTLGGVKSAMVAMIDGERKWLKSCSGGALGESPRAVSFCSHTILREEVMWIEDSRLDERFADNPLVTGPKRLNFYAGAPIIVGGHKVGTLCLNDETPRAYDHALSETLRRLASMTAQHLAQRRMQMMSASVLGASADAVICTNERQSIIYWNTAAERMFGYTAAEMLGSPVTLLAVPTQRSEQRSFLVGVLHDDILEKGSQTVEITACRKDGGEIPVEVTWTGWSDGDRPGLSLIVRDCSKRRRASHALETALSRAEAASLAKTNFLANMSHEIRTPLNGVLGVAGILALGELTPAQAQHVEIIRRCGDDLLGLLNNVLDTAKIEAGQIRMETAEFNLGEVLGHACESSAVLAREKGVDFELEVPPELAGSWRGDPGRLRQVVHNLAANAVKFTPSGRIRVAAEPDGPGVLLRVTDTGVGISEAVLPHLFGKFVQADASTTRTFGGSGLGLAICRELLNLMGGAVEVSSREGIGSEFRVHLPLVKAKPQALAA